MSVKFTGNNILDIADFLDTPELEKFEIISNTLYMEYGNNIKLCMDIGDIILLDDDNNIVILSDQGVDKSIIEGYKL